MCSREAFGDAYGFSTMNVIGWEDLANRSPVKEQTGVNDYTVVK